MGGFLLAVLGIPAVLTEAGALTAASPFTSDMVLQADRPVVVWGGGTPGAVVKGDLGGVSQTTTCGEEGKWTLTFPARASQAEGLTLTLEEGAQKLVLKNILFGDVWLCSGQSNMVRELAQTEGGPGEVRAAEFPQIRFLKIAQNLSRTPASRFEGRWQVCTPQTAGDLSAVAYYFAKNLQAHDGRPIGLIVAAVGGSPAEAWTPREALRAMRGELGEAGKKLDASEGVTEEKAAQMKKRSEDWKAKREALEDPAAALKEGWHLPESDLTAWTPVKLPGSWERVQPQAVDGPVWFRRKFSVEKSLFYQLALGVARNRARAWLNGRELAPDPAYDGASRTVFSVPAGALLAGENTVAVRLMIAGGKGGIQASDAALGLYAGPARGVPDIPLEGEWLCRIEQPLPIERPPMPSPWENKGTPGVLWNGMVAPLAPLALRGVLWYQGEANVSRADEYRILFPLLVQSWRAAWSDPGLPFLFVQLAGFQKPAKEPGESPWASLRQAQESVLALERTGMAVAYDKGDPHDIHPRNKKPVGDRLAAVARTVVYGNLEAAQALSPRVSAARREGEKIHLQFSPNTGLVTKDRGEVRGMAVAGEDRKFTWARARVEGSSVVVDAPPGTRWIRFAWANFPQANLLSQAGFPVAPFEWEMREP